MPPRVAPGGTTPAPVPIKPDTGGLQPIKPNNGTPIAPGAISPNDKPTTHKVIPSGTQPNPQVTVQSNSSFEKIRAEDLQEMLFPQKRAAWDDQATIAPIKLFEQKWMVGDVSASIEFPPKMVNAGERRLIVTVQFENKTKETQRIILTGLRFSLADNDKSACFFALPTSSLPAILPALGSATQTFRVDTFNDTPPGEYAVEPLALTTATDEELLQNGGFETNVTEGWGYKGNKSARIKSVAPLAELSNLVFD